MASSSVKPAKSEDESQLNSPTNLVQKEEWYYRPKGASYGPKKYIKSYNITSYHL